MSTSLVGPSGDLDSSGLEVVESFCLESGGQNVYHHCPTSETRGDTYSFINSLQGMNRERRRMHRVAPLSATGGEDYDPADGHALAVA